ncbi:gliding motility-associated C-terminal domain-containing protein [Pedobacter aquatilis]|uniref:T9SS type B sorting domain-containing protein n=1 Tax=Pedobacter aquatilis TaxID=351343 RepID=UPI002930614F|nr:gliding motility-associated C-terminal domain-containing protein [Pedobacter aquatilis]
MYTLKRLFILSVFSTFFSIDVWAQSLGDPIVNIDFGTGTATYAGALPAGTTSYTYVAQAFPNDGSYTVMKSTAASGNVWWSTQDHTGSVTGTYGYMMVVNASVSTTDYFYKTTVSNLCPNTAYEFGAWVVNLLRSSDNSPPNITFTIEKTDGTIIQSYTTGQIPLTPSGPTWVKKSFNFSTPAGVTDVVLRMRNNSAGGAPANDLALDDITFSPYGPSITAGLNSGASSSLTFCEGSTGVVNLQASVSSAGGYTTPAYQWQRNINGAGWTDIPGATNTTASVDLTGAASGTYLYRLAVGESANFVNTQCRIVSSVLTVNINPLPAPAPSSNSPLCVGETLNLVAQGAATSTYSWTGPNNFTSALQNPSLTGVTDNNAGTYTVKVKTTDGCETSANVNVAIGTRPASAISENVTICEGSATTLTASGGVRYAWTPATGLSDANVANPVATPSVTTTYTVSVYDASSACPATGTVTVTVNKLPVANAGPDKSLVVGNSISLDATTNEKAVTYNWSPVDFLDDPTVLNPVCSATKNMTYTLTITSLNGCGISSDDMNVKVYEKLSIPNGITPNGDGVNDQWNIPGLDSYSKVYVKVFNRYGAIVYQSTVKTVSWDGTYKGKLLPEGVYYYSILLDNEKPLSGWILLKL